MAWAHAVRERISALVRGGARDREFAEEVRHHLALEVEAQIRRGVAPDAARAAALARFGDPVRIAEATRDARGQQPLEGGMQDVRWAVRALRKRSGFTALALITLALGIGAITVGFTVLDTVLLRPLPYRDSGRLVLLRERTRQARLLPASFPNFDDWRTQARTVSAMAATTGPDGGTARVGDDAFRVTELGVSRGFFSVLGVRPRIGRPFSAEESRVGGPCAVMASHAFWQVRLGGRASAGTISVDGTPCDVVGVLPAGFRFGDQADLYVPLERGAGTVRSAHAYQVIGRLAPNATLAGARREMTAIARRLAARYGNETDAIGTDVMPLREYLVGDYRLLLTIVFGAAGLVLLIACTNLVSAQLARGMERRLEIAVRSALGAARGRIVRQLLVESGLLALAGGALGIGFALVLTRVVRLLGSGLVPRLDALSVNGSVLAFVGAVTIVTSLMIGLYPAYRLVRGNPGGALRGAGRGGDVTVRAGVWRALIAVEIATAVVLLVGSALLVHTLHNILAADIGFDPHGVMTVELNPESDDPGMLDRLRAQLGTLAGVEGVAYSTQMPLQWGMHSAPVRRPGDPVDHDWPALAGYRVVSADYFSVLRQRIERGRGFTDADRAEGLPVAVVTPGVAQALWPGEDPIGKRVGSNYREGVWYTVVGVAAEASNWAMQRGVQNEIYVVLAQQPEQAAGELVVFLRTRGDARGMIPAVRARLRTIVPGAPAGFGTMEGRIAASASDRRFAMFALLLFAAIALVLAGVGIYGVMAYTVATRRHEIGLRMALGATPARVQRHVIGGAVGMAVGGIAAGLLAAGLATRFLQSVLYGVTPFDPVAYAAGAVMLFFVAVLGAYVPARRSSRVDPALTMRGGG